MQNFWPFLAAPLLNLLALLLALCFRRNRAVLVLVVATLAALALFGQVDPSTDHSARDVAALRMFLPWLLIICAVMPERSLLAPRNLTLFLAIAISVWLTLAASAHLWAGLRDALPLGWLPWSAGAIAATLIFVAASICILRWILRGAPIEGGLGTIMVLIGIAVLPVTRPEAASILLALAGSWGLIAVLYASYRMAFVDVLSGLPNRRALDETLSRLSGNYAVAMVDIDHFKQFNDTHGHDAGDRVLQAVAQLLRRTQGGRAFRYGGEEFCLLFNAGHSRTASEACEASRQRIESERVRIRSAPTSRRRAQAVKKNTQSDVRVTVSIGLAARDAQIRTPHEVLKAADQALYKAKGKGRNRVMTR